MCRILIFATCCVLFASVSFGEKGELKLIPKEGVEKMAEVAVKERSNSVAICCYGMYFEKGGDPGSKLTADTIIKFSKKKGLYNKATAIASFYDVEKIVPNIIDYKDGELAAQLLATKAFHNIMYQNGIVRSGLDENGEMADAGKGKGKGKNNKKKKPAKNKKGGKKIAKANMGAPEEVSLSIPDELFSSKSTKTQYLAILAAAYTLQKDYADKVAKVAVKTGEIAAAKLLFQAMTGEALKDADVKTAFGKCGRIDKPIDTTAVKLSDIDMNVPGLATLCEALGRTKDKKYLGIIVKALGSKDERVKIDAVRAIRRIGDMAAIPYVIKLVEKAEWSTLIEVCLALGENPRKEAIEPLIKRFKKETGRFRLDVNYALASICGKRHGYTADEWIAWWAKNKRTFKVDPVKSKEFREGKRLQDIGVPPNGAFYSISIFSDRFSFVVDYSNSMKGDKIVNLKENMTDTVTNLTDNVQFTIVDFGGDVNLFYDALTNNKKKANKYIQDSIMTGATRSMDAMEKGMMVSEVDTIYFLSDGAPVRGQFQSWGGIQQMVHLMNRYRHIAFSTICFKAGKSNADSMAGLADQNYGHTEEIQ